MGRRYHIIEKQNTEAVRGFLSKNGQALLPLVEQIEQGEVALDEWIVPLGVRVSFEMNARMPGLATWNSSRRFIPSFSKLGMVLHNPSFHNSVEFRCLRYDFFCFRFRRHMRLRVIDLIALASACLEVVRKFFGGLAQGPCGTFQRDLVVGNLGRNSVSGTGNGHIGGLESCVVGRSKSTICRNSGDNSIS